ncbi:MAG: protein-L-isoaspartate(D-aspartate) O-methyltransferase [Methanobacteriota archaeon]
MFDSERENLIERLVRWGYLRKPNVVEAFRKVPRHEFMPISARDHAYSDQPLPIGRGQTISAPSMIAIMMESLDLSPGLRVLEIGAGSGYNAALVAEVVGRNGEIVTVERVKELADFAEKNLRKTGYGWVRVVISDGSFGYEAGAPWDRILVTACAPEIPKPLVEQLKVGGKLGAPVGGDYMFQTWTVAEKLKKGEIIIAEHGGCSFVPLIGKCGWKRDD